MGQNLGIGVRYSATAIKSFIESYPSEGEACAAFEKYFEINSEMYDKETDSNGDITYRIKQDIMSRDFKPMLRDFYQSRYPEGCSLLGIGCQQNYFLQSRPVNY